MIRFKIQEIDSLVSDEANSYFPEDYLEQLEESKPNSFNESLVSRYLVSKMALGELEIEDFIPEIDVENEDYEDFFYSISHKDDIVFV
jgi:hypothetical protein